MALHTLQIVTTFAFGVFHFSTMASVCIELSTAGWSCVQGHLETLGDHFTSSAAVTGGGEAVELAPVLLQQTSNGAKKTSCELVLQFKGKVKLTELVVECSAAAVELFAGEQSEYCGSARAKDVIPPHSTPENVDGDEGDGGIAVVSKRKLVRFAAASNWAASCYRLKLLKLAPAGQCTIWTISAIVTESTAGPMVSGIDLQAVRERLSGVQMGDSAAKLMASMESRAAAGALQGGMSMESLLLMGRAAFGGGAGGAGGAGGVGGAGPGGSVGGMSGSVPRTNGSIVVDTAAAAAAGCAGSGNGVTATSGADGMAAAAQLFARFSGARSAGSAGTGTDAGTGTGVGGSIMNVGDGNRGNIASLLSAMKQPATASTTAAAAAAAAISGGAANLGSVAPANHPQQECACCAAATLAAEAAQAETVVLAAQLSRMEQKLDKLLNGLQHLLPGIA